MIYLDNAATTIVDAEVNDVMITVMQHFYGNPSSSHSFGVEAKTLIEESASTIAKLCKCHQNEIIFTSGGTEAINLLFYNVAHVLKSKYVITSPLEHPAVLESIKQYGLAEKTHFVKLTKDVLPDMNHLEELLHEMPGAFVSLMHVHNESGSLLDIQMVGELCKQYEAVFFSDTVQSMGKSPIDFQAMNLDFAVCSAHKLHGPKGVGFLIKNRAIDFKPQLVGGGQSSGMRAGTENTAGIAGVCKALEIAHQTMSNTHEKLKQFKQYLAHEITTNIPTVQCVGDLQISIPQILTLALPFNDKTQSIHRELDALEFVVSAGSACHSLSDEKSMLNHVCIDNHIPLRISMSKFTTQKEIELFLGALLGLLKE
jgi:cysteine desulfurase